MKILLINLTVLLFLVTIFKEMFQVIDRNDEIAHKAIIQRNK